MSKEIYRKIKKNQIKISLKYKSTKGEVVKGFGSGFVHNKNNELFLATNEHVARMCDGSPDFISLIIYNESLGRIEFFPDEFDVQSKSIEADWDWIVIKLLKNIRINFEPLTFTTEHSVGEKIYFCGYPLDSDHLTFTTGIISSTYNQNSVSKIQLDASINSGNSGGALFNTKSEVIGIVTRKATGFILESNKFEELLIEESKILKSIYGKITQNISTISKDGPTMLMGDIDTRRAILSTFDELASLNHSSSVILDRILQVWLNMKRSANVGIGYAYSIDDLLNKNRDIFN